MIKIENVVTPSSEQWLAVIRGMRNPLNSWKNSDTAESVSDKIRIGRNDLNLMQTLVKAGTDHAKFMRMLPVMVDIVAPRYWWSEFDTYKVGTVANSTSTMHKIHAKEFTMDDFSHEHLLNNFVGYEIGIKYNNEYDDSPEDVLEYIVYALNKCREKYLETKDKKYWWQMIQLLPQSYNQRRTIFLNYEVLRNMYHARKNHKLDEWVTFCKWIYSDIPYAKELICCGYCEDAERK